MNTDNITCTRCSSEIHWLEVFPGNICLECHAAKTAHMTPDQIYSQIIDGFSGK
jgi:hypothetical protein